MESVDLKAYGHLSVSTGVQDVLNQMPICSSDIVLLTTINSQMKDNNTVANTKYLGIRSLLELLRRSS